MSRNRNDEGRRTRCNYQLVVSGNLSVFRCDRFGFAVDFNNLMALVKHHAMVDVPAITMDDDVFERLFAGQNR